MSEATVLLLGAGGPAGINFATAARKAGHRVIGFDDNPHALRLANADEHKLVTGSLFDDVSEAADREGSPVLIHAQPDSLVTWLSDNRDEFGAANVYLPPPYLLELCADKWATAARWADAGLRQHPAMLIGKELPDWLTFAKDLFGLPYWLRATHGAGARAATLVQNVETGYHWIRYWQSRGAVHDFIAEEYLPGAEYCWTGLYWQGELVSSFARQRLEWIYPHLAPSGRTGTPMAAVTVWNDDVNTVAESALAALATNPADLHGVFCVDMVEATDGIPNPTEVNAGRFATTSPIYHERGVNQVDQYIQLATDPGYNAPTYRDCVQPGQTLVRHIDAGHAWIANHPGGYINRRASEAPVTR